MASIFSAGKQRVRIKKSGKFLLRSGVGSYSVSWLVSFLPYRKDRDEWLRTSNCRVHGMISCAFFQPDVQTEEEMGERHSEA